jgi:hypothetical protein
MRNIFGIDHLIYNSKANNEFYLRINYFDRFFKVFYFQFEILVPSMLYQINRKEY